MKIACISYHSIKTLNGISTFNLNLYKIFGSSIDFFSIYCNKERKSSLEKSVGMSDCFFFRAVNYLSGYKFSSLLLKEKLIDSEYDIYIVNSPSLVSSIPHCKKIILVQHQDFSVMMKNKSNFGSNSKLLSIFDKISFFIALSPLDMSKVQAYLPEGARDKVTYIRHMADLEATVPVKSFSRSLVMLTRLDVSQKRLDLAIKAMRLLPNWSLTIYGSGNDERKLKNLVADFKLKNVHFAGNTHNVKASLSLHDIHIMTSDFEGYPFTNIEAMSCSIPLVVRNTFTSASDVILENGYLLSELWSETEFIEALENIESNYKYYSDNSRRLFLRHSKEIISNQWLSIFDLTLGQDHEKALWNKGSGEKRI